MLRRANLFSFARRRHRFGLEVELRAQHELAWRDERRRELIIRRRDAGRYHTLRRILIVQVQRVDEEADPGSSTEREVLLQPGIQDIDVAEASECAARLEKYRGRSGPRDRSRKRSRPNSMGALPGVETRRRQETPWQLHDALGFVLHADVADETSVEIDIVVGVLTVRVELQGAALLNAGGSETSEERPRRPQVGEADVGHPPGHSFLQVAGDGMYVREQVVGIRQLIFPVFRS